MHGTLRGCGNSGGQALALFALSITMLLGMASLAIDVGRLLAQQRYLQNAADASALAAAKQAVLVASAGSGTVADVRAAAESILEGNLVGSPAGAASYEAPLEPVLAGTKMPRDLVDGILITDAAGTALASTDKVTRIADIRVAARSRVDFMLGRVLGVETGSVTGRAHVGLKARGNLMPIAVRRYIGGSGPNDPVPAQCPMDPADEKGLFFDLAARWEDACKSSIDPNDPSGYNGRGEASPQDPGPITELVGQGAQAAGGGVSFRGFVNLDVRNFLTSTHRYYNGLTPSTSANSVKAQEAGWVMGYPGPDLGTVVHPSDGSNQVGILDGNSAGMIVKELASRFEPDDVILAALYDGTVRTIPAFLVREDSAIPPLTAGGAAIAKTGKYTIDPDLGFLDMVRASLVGKPAWLAASAPAADIDPRDPQQRTFGLASVAAQSGTPAQIDSFWLKAIDTLQPNNQNAPDFYLPVAVQVGDVGGKDFGWLPRTPTITSATSGTTASLTLTLTTTGLTSFSDGNAVSVTLAETRGATPGAAVDGTLPAGTYWFGNTPGTTSATVRLQDLTTTVVQKGKNGNLDVTRSTYTGKITVNVDTAALLATGRSTFTIPLEMTATTASGGRRIRHLDVLHVNLAEASTEKNYVEILGYAAYRITAIDSNTVWGRIVSPVRLTPDDPLLMAALTPRLIPW